MLAFREDTEDGASLSHWRPLRLNTKAALPIEECVVVTGRCTSAPARQLTCIGGHVKPSPSRLLLVLALPLISQSPSHGCPVIQVLEVCKCAVNFLQDVKACFPSLVRKNPLADASDDSDSESESDQDDTMGDTTRNKRNGNANTEASAATATPTGSEETAAFLTKTRVRVLASADALCEAYGHELLASVQCSVHATASFLCLEFPPSTTSTNEQPSMVTVQELNYGVLFVHDRQVAAPRSPQYLQIPLLREPDRMFSTEQDSEQEQVFQDATVFTFSTKRESSEHGGGKTSEETIKNIRLRHASGTFCTLVLPTMQWSDVVRKYAPVAPQLQQMQGELRSRRFMGFVSNRATEILLEDD